MQAVLLKIILHTKTHNLPYKTETEVKFNILIFSNCRSDPQVHAAPGRCTECLSMWPLSDCTGCNVLRCIFPSYGTV